MAAVDTVPEQKVARPKRVRSQRRASWQAEHDRLAHELAIARARGAVGVVVPSSLTLRRGERAIGLFPGTLVEPRRRSSTHVAAVDGTPRSETAHRFSLPGRRPKVIDTGTVVLTDKRVIFTGPNRTRDWDLSRLVHYRHENHPAWTAIEVADRRALSGVGYTAAVAEEFRARFRVAVALAAGTIERLVADLRHQLDEHVAARPGSSRPAVPPPVPPPAAAPRDAGPPPAPPPSPPPDGRDRHLPRWARSVMVAALLVAAVGAGTAYVVLDGRGSSDVATAERSTEADAAGPSTTVPSTTVPSTTVPSTTLPSTTATTTAAPRANQPCAAVEAGRVWNAGTGGEITCTAFEGTWVWLWTPPRAGEVCLPSEVGSVAFAGTSEQLTCVPSDGAHKWVPSEPEQTTTTYNS